jgi:hypothetical protein
MQPDQVQHSETCCRVLGASAEGKSFFLAALMKHVFETGDGVCMIDPIGELCRGLLQHFASRDETPAPEDHHG